MRYTLKTVLRTAERHGIYIGIEPHQSISKTTAGLVRIATLVDSPMLRVNYDTGNAFLGGEDPYAGLQAVLDRVVHVHAKDISIKQAETEKGKVTGTPVGCACGDGVIDWQPGRQDSARRGLRRRVVGGVRHASAGATLSRASERCVEPWVDSPALRRVCVSTAARNRARQQADPGKAFFDDAFPPASP